MSRTTKTEYSKPDGWHLGHRLERQARPAGRVAALVEAELVAEGDEDDVLDMDQIPTVQEQMDMWDDDQPEPRHNTPCGGWCRRCLLHDDPGGCLVQWQMDQNLFYLLAGVPLDKWWEV